MTVIFVCHAHLCICQELFEEPAVDFDAHALDLMI